MVRLGTMAMATQLRPAGRSRAAAAATEWRPNLRGGSSPGKPSSADYEDTRDSRHELCPTRAASGDVEWNLTIVTADIDEYGNTYLVVTQDGRQCFGTHPTVAEKTGHEDVNKAIYTVGTRPTSVIDAATWKGTGCNLALTSPRSSRPRCA